MTKLLFIGILCTITATSFAQFKFKGVGGGLSFGSNAAISSSGEAMGVGIEVNALAQIIEKVDAEAALIIYLPSSVGNFKQQITTFNANGHYNFFSQDKFTAYGLAGLNFTFGKYETDVPGNDFGWHSVPGSKYSENISEVGLNIGAGGAYAFTDKLDGTAQLGYTLGDADQLFINLGVMYKF